MPRPPPRSRCSRATPSALRPSTSAIIRSAARDSGSSVVICEPTWTWTPTTSRPGRLRHVGEQQPRLADRHAELVAAHPGRDVRMAPGVDVGVHPQRHAGAAALADRLGVDALQLAARFGVDGLEAEGDRPRDLGGALADAGEDDLVREEAGLEGDLDLADRIAVGAGAEALDQAHQAERRVRLEGVVDAVPAAGQGGRQPRVAGADQRRAVDVTGRPDLARDGRQRDAVAEPRRRRARRSRWERREWRQARAGGPESDVTGPRDTPPIVCQGLDGACPGTFGVPVRFC